MSGDILLIIVVATALAFDFTNGFHDTANAMATTIATEALSPRLAVGLARVEVRRIFHQLRSRAIENFNEQFKTIFDGHTQVPTKGLLNTTRFALGAVFVYQLAVLYRHQHGQRDLRLGLKAFLKAA